MRLSARLLSKALRLPKADLIEILRLSVTIAIVSLRLRLLPAALNRAWIAPSSPGAGRSPLSAAALRKIMRLFSFLCLAAAISGPDATCLRRSLAFRDRLRRAGFGPALRYGARRAEGGSIAAHAWVELGGRAWDSYGSSAAFTAFLQ